MHEIRSILLMLLRDDVLTPWFNRHDLAVIESRWQTICLARCLQSKRLRHRWIR